MSILDIEINNALEKLKNGKVILYPTDTIWGIGCDATNENAIDRIYNIKNRDTKKPFVILVSDHKMLFGIVGKPPRKIIDKIISYKTPLTVIYDDIISSLPKKIFFEGKIAIRIAKDSFCQRLTCKFGKPIVSTSANISGQPNPSIFYDIDQKILKNVDYIVNLHKKKLLDKPSKIVSFVDGKMKVIRD